MAKIITVQQIADEEHIYNVGDKIRIKMQPECEEEPEQYDEYIGKILRIENGHITLGIQHNTKQIRVKNIDKIRFAHHHETFLNEWDI